MDILCGRLAPYCLTSFLSLYVLIYTASVWSFSNIFSGWEGDDWSDGFVISGANNMLRTATPTYMIDTRDRRITHNVAKINVDQNLDLIAGVYYNAICDLNLLETLPLPPFFSSLSLA